jgi:hypothetical protein
MAKITAFNEGREGIKWELGLSFLSGKVEFIAKIIKFCNSIDLKKLLA